MKRFFASCLLLFNATFKAVAKNDREKRAGHSEGAKATEESQKIRKMKKEYYYVYIMTNKSNKVLYTGMNNDLKRRTFEHKMKLIDGFTKKYNCTKLVFYETFRDPYQAIVREKQIKGWVRKKKVELIESMNPAWKDLSEVWI